MHSKRYTLIFALVVCVSCSVLLAFAAEALKPAIQRNIQLDIQKNILMATGLLAADASKSTDEILAMYKKNIEEKAVDRQGNIVSGKLPGASGEETNPEVLPLYIRKSGGKVVSYCIPISGKGLWSTIYGYLALEKDCNTIKGITFYKHGETPGLGAEIEKEWFTRNFKGKKIFDENGNLTSITIYKGKIPATMAENKASHLVDGISGATLTGKGVTVFLRKNLEMYLPLFKRIQKQGSLS